MCNECEQGNATITEKFFETQILVQGWLVIHQNSLIAVPVKINHK